MKTKTYLLSILAIPIEGGPVSSRTQAIDILEEVPIDADIVPTPVDDVSQPSVDSDAVAVSRWDLLLADFARVCPNQGAHRTIRPEEWSHTERLELCSLSVEAAKAAEAVKADTTTFCTAAAYACIVSNETPIGDVESKMDEIIARPSLFKKAKLPWRAAVDHSTRLLNKIERSMGMDTREIYDKCLTVYHDHFPCRDLLASYNKCRAGCKEKASLALINECVNVCKDNANKELKKSA